MASGPLSRSGAIVLIITSLVLAGMLSRSPVPVSGARPDTFVFGLAGDIDHLDYPVLTNGETAEVVTQIFNSLVRFKPGTLEIEPDLAESWSTSPDGLVWTFKLRKGVTFHDGTPWNAEAAKANIDRWADKNNPYHQSGADFAYWEEFIAKSYAETRVVDPYTLQIILKTPLGPLLSNLSIIAFDFASPASMKKYGGQELGLHPVGTGPYKFVEYVRSDHITLVANAAFFRKGLPKTGRVIYRVIKDNAARFLALKANEIQAMELPNPDDVRTARNDPGLKVELRPSFDTSWIQLNLNNSVLKDRRIREAIALAINRKAIVGALYGGVGEVADQIIPPLMWGRSPNIKGYPYDPERAKKLLAEAKYPNGFSIDFWYMPVSRPYFPVPKDIATAIANDLSRVGIRAHLITEDWATYLKDFHGTNKFPIFMAGWIGDTGDPDNWLGSLFRQFDAGSAYYSYDNPAVYSILAKARSLSDPTVRAKLYAEVQEMAARDIPVIPIAHAKTPILMRRNVEGLMPQPDATEFLETVELK